ncbi:MAG TPA: MarR family transcriptional regulator [Cyclobacteriaceae bacterium]|nr:MarR family transcriptional regulator [Cyclobacteriaceae bacterium]
MKINDSIQQVEFENPQTKAWVNLMFTYHHMIDKTRQVFKQFGLTQQQYNVLRILKGKKSQPATCGEVKRVMLDKNPDLSRLCDRLVAKKLVVRGINENNRREVELTITAKGLELLDAIYLPLKETAQLHNSLTDLEAEQLSDLLDKLRQ